MPLAEGLRSVVEWRARDRRRRRRAGHSHDDSDHQAILRRRGIRAPFSAARDRAGSCRARSSSEFEERFGAFTGRGVFAATSSCTTALHLAVAALGVEARRRGDRAGLHVGLDAERRRVHGRDAGVLRHRSRRRSTSTPARDGRRGDAEDRRHHPGASLRPVRGHGRRSASSRAARALGRRGRRLRVRRSYRRPSRRHLRRRRAASAFIRASRSRPAKAAW